MHKNHFCCCSGHRASVNRVHLRRLVDLEQKLLRNSWTVGLLLRPSPRFGYSFRFHKEFHMDFADVCRWSLIRQTDSSICQRGQVVFTWTVSNFRAMCAVCNRNVSDLLKKGSESLESRRSSTAQSFYVQVTERQRSSVLRWFARYSNAVTNCLAVK